MFKTKLLLIFCVCVWGWTFVATKICLAYFDPLTIVGLRFLIGLPVLFFVLRMQRVPLVFTRKEFLPLMFGALIIAVHFLLQAFALTQTSATNTGWIITVTPLVMAILGYIVLHEKISSNAVTGILVATAGILLLVSNGKFGSLDWMKSTGDWMILASAHTWAIYTISTRSVSRSHNPLAVTLFVFAPVMLGTMTYALLSGGVAPLLSLPILPLIALVFLGVLGTLAQWFWQLAVARLGAANAGVYLYLEPVATTLLAVPLLNEEFTLFTALGGALVIGGVWWAQKWGLQRDADASHEFTNTNNQS